MERAAPSPVSSRKYSVLQGYSQKLERFSSGAAVWSIPFRWGFVKEWRNILHYSFSGVWMFFVLHPYCGTQYNGYNQQNLFYHALHLF